MTASAHYPGPIHPAPVPRVAAALPLWLALVLAACSSSPPPRPSAAAAPLFKVEDVAPEDPLRANDVLMRALGLVGTPYRWGGNTPEGGFDCSGLVGYVFRSAIGLELPRVSREMAKSGELVSDKAKLAAGDLVFFGRKGRVDHVGIYVGEGRFVHAPSRGKDVTVSSLEDGYWGNKFMQGRRVDGI